MERPSDRPDRKASSNINGDPSVRASQDPIDTDRLQQHRLLLFNGGYGQQAAMANSGRRPRLLPPPAPDRSLRSLLASDKDAIFESEIEEIRKRCDSVLLSSSGFGSSAFLNGNVVGGSSSSHQFRNEPQQQQQPLQAKQPQLQRPQPPALNRIVLRGSTRTLDLAQASINGIGFGLGGSSVTAAALSGAAVTGEQWRLLNRTKNSSGVTAIPPKGFRDSSNYSDTATDTTAAGATASATDMVCIAGATYPPISESQMIGASNPTATLAAPSQQQKQQRRALSNPSAYQLQRPSYGRQQAANAVGRNGDGQQEEKYRYPEAVLGGPASFVQRVLEMSALEGETIRYERAKASRRKAKNL